MYSHLVPSEDHSKKFYAVVEEEDNLTLIYRGGKMTLKEIKLRFGNLSDLNGIVVFALGNLRDEEPKYALSKIGEWRPFGE